MLLNEHTKVGNDLIYTVQSIPDTPSTAPSVVFVSGLSDGACVWLATMRLLPGLRSFAYDRLGLFNSDRTALPRDAATLAQELKRTLDACKVPSPYVLVLSSYAGIIGREFLQAFDVDVAAIVCVDANQERTLAARQWPETAWDNTFPAGMSNHAMTGLDKAHGCTEDEWAQVIAQEATNAADTTAGRETGEQREGKHCLSSLAHLGTHNQFKRQALGDRPLSVIQANLTRDLRRMIDAGKAQNRGTAADHAVLDEWLSKLPEVESRLHSEMLQLSSVHRLIVSSTVGHLAMLWEPELVAQEIEWCIARVQKAKKM